MNLESLTPLEIATLIGAPTENLLGVQYNWPTLLPGKMISELKYLPIIDPGTGLETNQTVIPFRVLDTIKLTVVSKLPDDITSLMVTVQDENGKPVQQEVALDAVQDAAAVDQLREIHMASQRKMNSEIWPAIWSAVPDADPSADVVRGLTRNGRDIIADVDASGNIVNVRDAPQIAIEFSLDENNKVVVDTSKLGAEFKVVVDQIVKNTADASLSDASTDIKLP